MSALVASRTSLTSSHPTSSTMDTKSPVSIKKTSRPEVSSDKPSASESSSSTKQGSGTNGVKASSPPPQDSSSKSSTQPKTEAAAAAEGSQPLAPPPRPNQSNAEGGDYFNNNHGSDSHFSLEPNPFEQSFGVPSTDTPGKSLLPPVASLTSPAPLGGNTSSASGFSWSNSLRAGPLSPAMLAGPAAAAATDYFGNHLRGGFPTPNESSLRTGLTPGGGGSMFPAASPNSQSLFNQLASGNATPSTLDFHRTAASAATVQSKDKPNGSVPHINGDSTTKSGVMDSTGDSSQVVQSDPFSHDAKDAANGLFLLAQARNGTQGPGQYVAVNQQSSMPSVQPVSDRNGRNMSGSSESARGMSMDSQDFSEGASNEQTKPNTRNRGKKNSTGGKGAQTNGRRKAEETPSKAPANKKAKMTQEQELPDSDDEDVKMEDEQLNENGRKMTDEEKRKNFLERNRVAALKCRQRKKQWLANLQTKVEIFSGENDALSAQVTQLREEIVNLKTLLLAHKDCPVSQAQGLNGLAMNAMGGDYNHHANPYGMGIPNGAQVMAGQPMQRR